MSLTRTLIAAMAFGLGLSSAALAEDQTITIAYQTGFSPWTRAVASGEFNQIPGWKV